MSEGEGNCLITDEALLNVGAEIKSNKAVDVGGMDGRMKELIEKRTGSMLRVLNAVNVSGRIPAIWEVVRVVFIPKPGRDPALLSDALRELADSSKRRKWICVLAAVDTKNAFNTLRWNKILLEAEARGMTGNFNVF